MPSKADTAVACTIGIDTGKNTLHMIGLDEKGAIVLREKVSRTRIATRLANVPPCLIGIEAGMASHHVARELVALGHEVKQVPPAYSKPFRQGHKNDFRDAHAVAEAAERPSTRCGSRNREVSCLAGDGKPSYPATGKRGAVAADNAHEMLGVMWLPAVQTAKCVGGRLHVGSTGFACRSRGSALNSALARFIARRQKFNVCIP